MRGEVQRPLVAALLAALNLVVAALVGFMLNEVREIRREMHVSIALLEERNRLHEELSNQIRVMGFERLSKVEALLDEHQRRIDVIEARMDGRRKPEFPEHGGLDNVSPGGLP